MGGTIGRVGFGLAVSALALAVPAHAQTIGRVVAFGDSYADTGNLKAILGPFFPTAEYPTGRFSGGTNFVDTLASIYNAQEVDYAVGGAQAGSGNVVLPGLPGFQQQWTQFVAAGGSFGPNDLLALSVGGNDARGYRTTGTLAGADAAAATTAANATAGIQALVARGVRRMVFIVGDTGQLPEALGKANAATGTAFSVAYNNRMQAVLSPIAASGVTVAYVDVTAIGTTVRANPGRFGFVDVTTACPQTCIGSPAQQAKYFFYVDGIHLTSAAFALVGRYAANQLAAPYTLRAVGDLPLRAATDFGRSLNDRLDIQRGGGRDGVSVFGSFTGGADRRSGDDTANGYSYSAHGATGGVEARRGPLTGGVAFGWSRGRDTSTADDRARDTSYQIGGYAGYDTGTLFAQGYGGYGWHRIDTRRTGVADPLVASPHATSVVAGGRAGWLAPTRFGRIGPVAGLAYARVRLDGYTESGDGAADLIVLRQHVDTLTGSAGLEYRPEIAPGFSPWIRATAEKTLNGDGRDVAYAAVVAPTIVNGFAIGRTSERVYGAVAGGLSAHLTTRLALDGSVRGSVARPEGHDVAGTVGLRLIL